MVKIPGDRKSLQPNIKRAMPTKQDPYAATTCEISRDTHGHPKTDPTGRCPKTTFLGEVACTKGTSQLMRSDATGSLSDKFS